MELPRGMRDVEPVDLAGIEHVRRHFGRTCTLYGFSMMDPSPIEMLSVLEAKSGPAIRDGTYNFTDKGGRDVALRFDFTVGLTRYMASQKTMRLPAKVSSFGGVFRYDEPQKGRYRYFHQWDVEIYGRPNLETEAEIIEMTSRLFDALGLKGITIEVNHRRTAESYIASVFGGRQQPALTGDMLRAIDKSAKKPRQAIIDEYADRYDPDKIGRILDFARISGTVEQVQSRFDTSGLDSWDHIAALLGMLEERNITNVRSNFGIVRGLDYYSGMVFEVFDGGDPDGLGALAGGGRYDSLTDAFGRKDIGAAGVAGGVERIMLAMRRQGVPAGTPQDRVAVLYVNDEMRRVASSVASLLRFNGIPADIDLAGRSLKKQMESASSTAKSAVIIGPQELQEGNVVVRDMGTGQEGTVPLEKMAEDPRAVLNP